MKWTTWFVVLFLGLCCFSPSATKAAEVRIQEWELPTAISFPHDPAVAPDGALWYTGMRANTLGRLDPATGRFREYALPTAGSGPHGLVSDNQGKIWFTANARGYIGRLDPESGQVTEYPMPDPAADDPHTLATPRAASGSPSSGGISLAGSIPRTAGSP